MQPHVAVLGLGAMGRRVAVRLRDAGHRVDAWNRSAVELATHADPARFLAAPMVGSRPQIEAGLLAVLVGGSPETLERVRPLLDAVAGSVLHVGDAGDAAALKLAVNGLLVTQFAVAGELLGMLRDGGADLHAAAGVLGALPVTSVALSAALPRVLGGALAPNFPLDLVDKDLGYLLAQAAGAPVLEAVRRSVRARDPEHDVLSLADPKRLG